jgi:hypothetical protein
MVLVSYASGYSWFPVQKDMSAAVNAGDMEVFSVAYVNGSIARQVLRGVSCVACKICLTFQVLLSASVFVYFKEYSYTEQFLTYPFAKLVKTVGTAVTLMESVVAEVAHLNSVEQRVAIKNSTDFEWIRYTGCSLHHQQIVNGVVTGHTRIYIPWWCKQANRLKSETVRQRATERNMKIEAHQ